MQSIKLIAIVAATNNDVIGDAGAMPWHLPKDLAYFKKTTINHPIIMGRNTYQSIGRALPMRQNIVISRNKDYKLTDAIVCNSIDTAIIFAKKEAIIKNLDKIFIIGGAKIFDATIKKIDYLYLNRINADITGDTKLPKINWQNLQEISRKKHKADSKNIYDFDSIIYKKIG